MSSTALFYWLLNRLNWNDPPIPPLPTVRQDYDYYQHQNHDKKIKGAHMDQEKRALNEHKKGVVNH